MACDVGRARGPREAELQESEARGSQRMAGAQGGLPAATRSSRLRRASFHCPVSPVLPTERIAHLGTAGDCCAAGFRSGLSQLRVKLRHGSDVRCKTAFHPKAEVHPLSCYVAQVPKRT